MFSVWEWLSSDKMMIIDGGNASYLYINCMEIKGTQGIIASHWKDLQMTCKDSQTILKLCMTPCEWKRLTGSYSWPPEAFSLRLGVGWPRERVRNTFQTKCFQIRKANWNSVKLQFRTVLWPCSDLNYSLVICKSQNICSIIPRQISEVFRQGFCKGWIYVRGNIYKRKPYPNTVFLPPIWM